MANMQEKTPAWFRTEPVDDDGFDRIRLRLIARRHDLGLTQGDVNDRIGVTDALLAKWECGMKRPSGFNLFCWAQALGFRLTLELKE